MPFTTRGRHRDRVEYDAYGRQRRQQVGLPHHQAEIKLDSFCVECMERETTSTQLSAGRSRRREAIVKTTVISMFYSGECSTCSVRFRRRARSRRTTPRSAPYSWYDSSRGTELSIVPTLVGAPAEENAARRPLWAHSSGLDTSRDRIINNYTAPATRHPHDRHMAR